MHNAGRFRLEIFFDFFLFVLGFIIIAVSWGYGFGSLSRPGPGLYPALIGVVISIFSFFILVSELKSKASKAVLDKESVKTLTLMALTSCLWIVAMPFLGYVVVSLIATYAFCKIMKLEGWRKPLAVSGGTALFLYLLFDYWMYIDLPRGILG
jgi:putative tricarboxylic transport membrane protein